MQGSISGRSTIKTIDWRLIGIYLALVFIGWLNVYASVHSAEPESIFDFSFRCGKQFVWIITGLSLAALIVFVINPKIWYGLSAPLYLLVLLLLIAVVFVGKEVNGSHSWFALGPISFQPAEISKISTALLLARIMSASRFNIGKLRNLGIVLLILAIPMVAILAEKETGCILVYIGFVFTFYREGLSGWFLYLIGVIILLFISALKFSPFISIIILLISLSFCKRYITGEMMKLLEYDIPAIGSLCLVPRILSWIQSNTDISLIDKLSPSNLIIGACLVCLPIMIFQAFKLRNANCWGIVLSLIAGLVIIISTDFVFENILQDHQKGRIEVLLGMRDDPTGIGYNVHQSLIAIGSGGFFGKGFLHGTQTTYGFVPEQSTDFIFCTVGEEWGFVGCVILIVLYVLLISRIINDAEQCREKFSRIYGYCVASMFFMHLFINIGMTIGIMPIIGIPLPLVSYGGSSLWAFTLLLFIFVALHRQEKKYF